MTKTELRYIVDDLIEELRELSDGYGITSGGLLKRFGYDPADMEADDLFEFHNALFRASKANHITLDMSKHENKVEGFPWDLVFAVRNKKAQIKCPYCGSMDTARILYGLHAFSDELLEKMNSGKVHLGGCLIMGIKTEDGEIIQTAPRRYCNHCRKEFAKSAYRHDKDHIAYYPDIVEGLDFEIGGYVGGTTRITIRKNPKGALVHVDYYNGIPDIPPADRQITHLRWMRLIDRLFNELYLHEWKKKYADRSVLDGTQWHLEISLSGRRKRTIYGSNAFPPYWSELKSLFRPFGMV